MIVGMQKAIRQKREDRDRNRKTETETGRQKDLEGINHVQTE